MKIETVEEFLKRGGKINRVGFRESKKITYREQMTMHARVAKAETKQRHPWKEKS